MPVGYLVVSEAINKPGLIEAGGEPTAVATLVQAALSRLADGVTFDAPSLRAPTVLAEVVEQAIPGRRRAVTDGMMVRVNDIDALLGRPAPLELSHRAWAAALFGTASGTSDAADPRARGPAGPAAAALAADPGPRSQLSEEP